MVNHLAYDDDLVILSPAAKGLHKLLMAKRTTLCSITHKPECMYFPVKGRALINVPKVFLNFHLLRWVYTNILVLYYRKTCRMIVTC